MPVSETAVIELRQRIYNLSLYIAWLEEKHPRLFKKLEKEFDGLPGYAGEIELE